jgi:hypothetical protein
MLACRRLGVLLSVLALALVVTATAPAAVQPLSVIDGPSPDVGVLGGAAMSADGTGGVAYLRTQAGQPHVFAARFDGRRWAPPQRVDVGQAYASAWPRIAAADHGRLVVVWAQDGGPGLDGLYSAVVQRGASHFLAPTLIDFAIGEDLATYPSLAMNAEGNALLAYRAISAFTSPALPSGYVQGDVRLARFDGSRWQRLGTPANRNRAAPVPTPTAANAPQVALDASGTGVIAWQEPDDGFIPRIWARRIFGTRLGTAQQASPATVAGQPSNGAADAVALSVSASVRANHAGLGQAAVIYRQQPDPRDRAAQPQLYVNALDIGTSGSTFAGPKGLGTAGDARPSLSLAGEETALVATAQGGAARLGWAGATSATPTLSALGTGDSDPSPIVVAGTDGHGLLATAGPGGGGEVLATELDRGSLVARQALSADPGGPIRALAAGGSGLGDALVAFTQGADGDERIAAAIVDAPPSSFGLTLADGWSRSEHPRLSWDPATDALGGVTYTVAIDGRRVLRTRATAVRLPEGSLQQGSHAVLVTATDALGQTTAAPAGIYRLDRQAPRVSVRVLSRRRVTVTITDPGGTRASGPASQLSTVTWGDGNESDSVTARARHIFKTSKRGRRTVTVTAVDAAGNRTKVARAVTVR